MSGRLYKKVLKELEEESKHNDTEEDEDLDDSGGPFLCNRFANLLQDDEGSEKSDEETEIVVDSSNVKPASKNTSYKKKKTKKRKEPGSKMGNDEITLADFDWAETSENNNIQETTAVDDSLNMASSKPLLQVDPNYLNLEKQFIRTYGSELVTSHARFGQQPRVSNGVYHLKTTVLISASRDWPLWDRSYSMDFIETRDGHSYFKYNYHSEAYEEADWEFFMHGAGFAILHHPYHVGSLLNLAESFDLLSEHQKAEDAIGQCLYGLERAWHPSFTPLTGNCRLSCSHPENKPFYRCLLARIRIMDWSGIHKSALELCKFLLSLQDPTDALLCVDYFALRVRDYAWLERFVDEYRGREDHSLWHLPNFSYSLAVARLYLEKTESSSSAEATSKASSLELMKQALILHPTVLKKLVKKVPLKGKVWDVILAHPYFNSDESNIPSLDHLIKIYVERSYPIWRLPDVRELLVKAAFEDISLLEQNKTDARDWLCVRKEAFPAETNEYSHLLISDFSDTSPSIPEDVWIPLAEEFENYLPVDLGNDPPEDLGHDLPEDLQDLRDDPETGGDQLAAGGGDHHEAPLP